MTRTETSSIAELRAAVCEMDRISQHAFAQIEAVAKLAADAMRPRAGCDLQHGSSDDGPHPTALRTALQMIIERAEDGMNAINVAAEEVGANYREEA